LSNVNDVNTVVFNADFSCLHYANTFFTYDFP